MRAIFQFTNVPNLNYIVRPFATAYLLARCRNFFVFRATFWANYSIDGDADKLKLLHNYNKS